MDEQKKEITSATAQQIRHFRQSKNMSQEDLALKANLNPAYLGQLERGLKCPTIDTIYKIAKALDLSLPELFAFDNKAPETLDRTQRFETATCGLSAERGERVIKIVEELAELLHSNDGIP